MELKTLNTFIEIAQSKPKRTIAVSAAEDLAVLQAISAAVNADIVSAVLIGDVEKIKQYADEIEFDISKVQVINEPEPIKSAKYAVKLVREGNAHILMKGLIQTADFLRAVLDKECGLRTGSLLSHIGFFELEHYHKVIALTDAAQNTFPELGEKVQIIQNSVNMFHRLGVDNPKVALLAAIEGVNPKMPNTMDAAAITMMNRRGQIKGCLIDGPLAMDLAVSAEAAHHKGIESEVCGNTDILFAPNIEVANVIYKTFSYLCGASAAACIIGAAAPIVLTSRADSENTKLLSIALTAAV
ncbi:MAG: bifunctional enoyl-CoA hydratase/phosphate acetyltransferase [bacterium]